MGICTALRARRAVQHATPCSAPRARARRRTPCTCTSSCSSAAHSSSSNCSQVSTRARTSAAPSPFHRLPCWPGSGGGGGGGGASLECVDTSNVAREQWRVLLCPCPLHRTQKDGERPSLASPLAGRPARLSRHTWAVSFSFVPAATWFESHISCHGIDDKFFFPTSELERGGWGSVVVERITVRVVRARVSLAHTTTPRGAQHTHSPQPTALLPLQKRVSLFCLLLWLLLLLLVAERGGLAAPARVACVCWAPLFLARSQQQASDSVVAAFQNSLK